ncbi:MAG TPA: OmpA family protein [Acetobacteraceae bacterium]|nr:OmpA family protein [Acetobacteraceae bacterium]
MRYRGAVLATALLATPLAAAAQPVSGLYVGAGLGADLPQNVRATPGAPSIGGAGHLKLEEHLGFDGIGAVGYGLGNGMRFEIQGDFARTGINELARTPFPASSSGTVHTYGVMVNALFDMDIGVPWLYPYLGVGAGYQWTHLDGLSVTQAGGPFRLGSNDTRGNPAGQLIAGVSMPIASVPGLSATAEYRFMDILGGEKFDALEVPTGGGGAVSTQLKLHSQYNNIFLVGLRYAFNTPPPPTPATAPMAQAAPAPAPSRSYLVFFDWDKATLTDRARQIIKEAADNSTRVQYTRIEVNGYTDTSGTPQYNMGLSIRRADAVAGALVTDGVPKSAISIQGFGETHLLVPTGAGVREPQNRRVEIIIR